MRVAPLSPLKFRLQHMPDGHDPAELARSADERTPHSIDAEQALLGAMMADNETAHRITDALRAEHFYDPVHGRIFTAAKQKIERGELADAITLTALAETDEGLKSLGGAEYLVDLMASGASAASAPDYARLIYDLALRRSLLRVGGEIEKDARAEREKPARTLVEEAERKLFDLAETGSAERGLMHYGDAIIQSIEMAAAAAQRQGGLSGVNTGFDSLNTKLGGLHKSDLIIIAGRPSMGKTAFATNVAYRMAELYRSEKDDLGVERTVDGGVVAFFSLEMSSEQLATRILADQADIPSHAIRQGEIDADQFERLRDAAARIDASPLYIDDTGGLSIGALCARARRMKRLHGLDAIFIDYLQLITSTGGKASDSRVQEVSQITQQLKALAKELDVPVIALSQLSRQVESREDKRPQLSDLRESGSIEQDADVVMFVYREEYYAAREEPKSKKDSSNASDHDDYVKWEEWYNKVVGKAEIIISKQRHGPIGTVDLEFDGSFTRFSDPKNDKYASHLNQPSRGGNGGGGPGLGR